MGDQPVTKLYLHRTTQIQKRLFIIIIIIIISGVGLSPLGTAYTSGLLYKPQMIDEGDCAAIGGMKIGRGNRSPLRKPAPAPLCPPHIPHDQTQKRLTHIIYSCPEWDSKLLYQQSSA
jgi:hypothetical protein